MTDNASVGAKGLCHVRSFEPVLKSRHLWEQLNVKRET